MRLTFHRFTSIDLDFFGGLFGLRFVLLVFLLGFLFVVFCLFASHVHPDLTSLTAVGHRQHAVPHTFCNITTVTAVMARTASDPKKSGARKTAKTFLQLSLV